MQAAGASPRLAANDAAPSNVSPALLVLPRVYLGTIFLVAAFAKLTAPPGFATALTGYLHAVALVQGFPWYREVVRAVILPHVALFAVLVTIGEVFVGVAMLLGIATRPASALAIFLLLNYLCSKGMPMWAPASNDTADIVLALVVGIGSAGRVYGLDGLLSQRVSGFVQRFF